MLSDGSVVIIDLHVGKNEVDVGIIGVHVGKIAIHVGITLKIIPHAWYKEFHNRSFHRFVEVYV